jgi:hypothetical protein
MKLYRQFAIGRKIVGKWINICECLDPAGKPGSVCVCGGAIPSKKEIDIHVALMMGEL